MAFVVESTSSANNNNANNIVITKPTGLAVGELMVAVLTASRLASTTVTTLSGWSLAVGQSGIGGASIQYKIADSGDVAADNFQFQFNATTVVAGSIMRLSNNLPSSFLGTTDSSSGTITETTSPTRTIAITPTSKEALVVVGFIGSLDAQTPGTRETLTYTSAPSLTFTELHDKPSSNSNSAGAAYATQASIAEITSYGSTYSHNKDRYLTVFALFYSKVNDSGSNTLVATGSSTFTQTGIADTVGSTALATTTVEALTQTGQGNNPPTQWSNPTKPTTTWTNTPLS